MFKIVTWNINGIRSSHQNLKVLFDSLDCDIICLQETKITRDMLDEATAFVEGYTSFYSFSRKRSGYSGVATYCKDSATPFKAEEGITGILNTDHSDRIEFSNHVHNCLFGEQLKELDAEGRTVMTLHQFKEGDSLATLVVINVYCPHACEEDEDRYAFKLQFYKAVELRCRDMLDQGYHVIVLGDINVSHRLIDHCEPEDLENFPKRPSRVWLDGFLEGGKFVDSFRHLYPTREKSFTCWNTKTNARMNNYGTRIDYIFTSSGLIPSLTDCIIMADVQGSDHCPVKGSFSLEIIPSTKTPAWCTRHFKEFSGKQLKMSNFFCKRSLTAASESESKKQRLIVKEKQSNLLQFFGQPKATAQRSPEMFKSSELLAEKNRDFSDFELNWTTTSTSCSSSSSAALWKKFFKGPPPPPMCSGHQEPCVLRTVKKKGPNMNRQFWACGRAAGHSTDPKAQCNFFKWASAVKR